MNRYFAKPDPHGVGFHVADRSPLKCDIDDLCYGTRYSTQAMAQTEADRFNRLYAGILAAKIIIRRNSEALQLAA